MTLNGLKTALLAGTASGALLLSLPSSAQAQNYATGPGFFLSLEGRYLLGRGDKVPGFDNDLFSGLLVPGLNMRADTGWGGKAMLGYRFTNNWDVGLGFAANRLKGSDNQSTTGVPSLGRLRSEFRKLKVRLNYQVVDFEAGYNLVGGSSTVRLFGGLRAAHFAQNAHAVSTTVITGLGTAHFDSRRKTSFLGAGPRLGVNGKFDVAGGFNLFGGISGAVLAGKFKDRHTVNANGAIYAYNDRNKTKLVPNAEGELGIGYNFTSGGTTIGLQLGYRAEKWWGVSSDAPAYDFVQFTHPSDQLVHGPFVRLVASFGAPTPIPTASPYTPPPYDPPNFFVFFDFDKSIVTAEAEKTIAQAAATSTKMKSTKIVVTGHTDRSGSAQYNLALSIRRAEAVKATLIRQGIPASIISVVGKGESVPLVPTPDGVREPQNRRVEIVI